MKALPAIFTFLAGAAMATLWFAAPHMLDMWPLLANNGNTIVIGATALLAAIIALWGVVSQRTIARRQMTYEQIVKFLTDKDLIEARRKFIELSKGHDGLGPYATVDKETSPKSQNIVLTLNFFELVSIGIQHGIIDYELFKMWNKTTVIQYWGYASPFASALRSRLGNDLIFHEFEAMANWFKSASMPPKRRWWWRQFT